jgi:hypothetical protein
MDLPQLPPLVHSVTGGTVQWDTLSDIDYSTIGYLLCCHLVMENYVDAYIRTAINTQFSLKAAKLTFGQKLSLIGSVGFPERYNFLPALKSFNSLRNRLSHDIKSGVTQIDLAPMVHYLEKVSARPLDRRDTLFVLREFTGAVCAWFGALISFDAGSLDIEAAFDKWKRAHNTTSENHGASDTNRQ